jgi:hypothetical protein
MVTESLAESIMAILVAIFLVTLYTLTYLHRPKFYLLDKDTLTICRPIKSIKIPIHEIKDAFIVRKETMMWTERVGGNGGLFGFYGEFKNSFGLTTWYATKLKNYILIETIEKDKFIITPDNTDMVKEIRRSIGK